MESEDETAELGAVLGGDEIKSNVFRYLGVAFLTID
jgi:hypothetical protein